MLSDIEIAQSAKIKPIAEIAEQAGIDPDKLEFYGKYKTRRRRQDNGKHRTRAGLKACRQESYSGIKRTLIRTCIRRQGRCLRRRLLTGRSYGGYQSPLHR